MYLYPRDTTGSYFRQSLNSNALLFLMLGIVFQRTNICFNVYLLSFIVGMQCSHYGVFESLFKSSLFLFKGILISILMVFIVLGNSGDSLMALYYASGALLLVFAFVSQHKLLAQTSHLRLIDKVFVALGKQSMNIFLLHTFLYLCYFQSFFYSFKLPFVSFILLLAISWIISAFLECVKEMLHQRSVYAL